MDIACKGASTGPLAHVAEAAGARVLLCPLTPTHSGFAKQMKQILREGKYDVVHNHLGNYSGFATWICRGQSTPSIASYHNTEFPPETWTRRAGLRQLRDLYSQRSMSYAMRNSQFVTGCSEAVLESLTTYAPRKDNWRVLPYGVQIPLPPSEEARGALRAEFGWEKDAPVILHVGRFVEQKNHGGLLEIFARISKAIPAARLLLVGDGPFQEDVKKDIAARGLQKEAVCAGVRTDVPQLMSNSDLFLFPSFHEGFGLVAIEANGAGLPVVASKIPGVTEAVADGETAFLFPLPGVEEMAGAGIKLLNNPDLRKKMGEAGRARVQRKFTRPASAQALLQLYRDCLPQAGSTPSP